MNKVQVSKPTPVGITEKTTMVMNIAPVKGLFGEKRIAELKKAVKNRDRRIKRAVKDIKGEYNQENYAKLARAEYVPGRLIVDFSKVTTVKEYNDLMRMLKADSTKEWKAKRTEDMRDALAKTVIKSVNIDASVDPALFKAISKLSSRQITKMRMENPEFFKDIYDQYDNTYIDADVRDYLWDGIRQALGLKPLEEKPDVFVV